MGGDGTHETRLGRRQPHACGEELRILRDTETSFRLPLRVFLVEHLDETRRERAEGGEFRESHHTATHLNSLASTPRPTAMYVKGTANRRCCACGGV